MVGLRGHVLMRRFDQWYLRDGTVTNDIRVWGEKFEDPAYKRVADWIAIATARKPKRWPDTRQWCKSGCWPQSIPMPETSYIAWRMSRAGFGLYHLTQDNKFTLCGRKPDGLLSVWRGKKPPAPELQCVVCRDVDSRELRNR